MTFISRLVSLEGFSNVVVGRDIGKALEEGIVYGISNVAGVITLTPIGEAVTPDYRQRLSIIITDGKHFLTKDEFRAELKAKGIDPKTIERYLNGNSDET